MLLTIDQIETLVQAADPDGAYTFLLDMGYDDEADYIHDKYLNL